MHDNIQELLQNEMEKQSQDKLEQLNAFKSKSKEERSLGVSEKEDKLHVFSPALTVAAQDQSPPGNNCLDFEASKHTPASSGHQQDQGQEEKDDASEGGAECLCEGRKLDDE